MVLMERTGVGVMVRVVAKGKASLMLAAPRCLVPHGAVTSWPPRPPAPTVSTPRDAQCSPRMGLQPWGRFWVLSVPFMGQHGTKCRLDHGAVWKLRWHVIQYLAGPSTTLSATDQVGAKPSETASGSGLTFAKFCMKYQFSTPFI